MKRYRINPIEKEFQWGEMAVVVLGERGRGRKETFVPYHAPKDAQFLEIGASRSGKPKIIASPPSEGWLAVVTGAGTYTRNTYGSVYVPNTMIDNVSVVAHGHGAYGDAGRIGGWEEFLITAKEGTLLKVRPAGGSHKIERYWLFFGDEEVITIPTSEMDLFCDQMGVVRPPEEFDELVNLIDLSSSD